MTPQASQELRDQWDGACHCLEYLNQRGWRLNRQRCWIPPTKDCKPTRLEYSAIEYLVEEWDYGGIYRPKRTLRERMKGLVKRLLGGRA